MVHEIVRKPELFVVDDDPDVRRALSMIFSSNDYQVTCFADGSALLPAVRKSTPECIILDVHIPGQSGLEVLKQLNSGYAGVPIIMISGQGDIPTAVDALKHGALDFVEKPFRASKVLEQVEQAINTARQLRSSSWSSAFQFPTREPLSRREREVLGQLVSGTSNKEAGRHLGISPRTVEVHRARIMEKLKARNFAELVRIAVNAEA